ncbi:alkaline shock response membrane anchor protein AmaP [Streptomyces sp. CB01881]|uniref:alkaline shock response membrane anchor protein AmaP n=1 Tax=Streptomyces sp. CB01881 TaxID=2078691 RepID=UPI000CDBF17D|nr:alkaline shock response membrane anchor protein AmaP [Streptomyces sp. CB01881]AUY49314.1 alkaline shock response membrane anchor protein AmaP [Streptomyces sp. CB01881]TYC72703.1 alkaline shock response membrane anchor protein AmaP [Streptomyces sp. CB01881]
MSRTTVNRVLLGVAGLVLFAVGVLVLAGGLDLYGRLGVDPPGWWPLTSPDQPVVSVESRTHWSDQGWWWPAVIGGLVVVVAGAAWWLFAQLRRSGPATVGVPTPGASGLRLRLRSRALEEVLETGAVALPEVDRADVHLVRGPRHPRLRAAVRLTPGGDPAALVEHFETGPRTDARTSLGLAELPADLRVRVVAAKPAAPGRGGRRKHPRVR